MAVLIAPKVCMVTYLRSTEHFTVDLEEIAHALSILFHGEFKVVICRDKTFSVNVACYDFPVELFHCSGTKFNRIFSFIQNDKSGFYLSIDNDIKGNIPEIQSFVTDMVQKSYDIGWGKIVAAKRDTLVSNLIAVDKLLSHYIIRPLLWRCRCGISVPGQIFCLKGDSFRGQSFDFDTSLDDLAVGLYVARHLKSRLQVNCILGHEAPNISFKGLCAQRKRWACGYVAILRATHEPFSRGLLWIHAFFYHFFWLLHWAIVIFLSSLNPLYALAYIVMSAVIMTFHAPKFFFYGVFYQIVFPVFHLIWIVEMFKRGLTNLEE